MGVALMQDPDAQQAAQACDATQCEAAIEALERMILRRPNDREVLFQLGICYGGGCRGHSLVRPEMAVAYLRRALWQSGPGSTRAGILDALGNSLAAGTDSPREATLREAICCHAEAAKIYRSLGKLDDWGRLQFNLGNFCCDLAEATGENHWPEAVQYYLSSLKVRTRQFHPQEYAAVLENLGTAYRQLTGDLPGVNVRKSIRCYRKALAVFTPAGHPGRSAALQNNLGNAYLSLPRTNEATGARNARLALAHFDRALRIQSSDKCSRAYGITQYNRAQAFLRLSLAAPQPNLSSAIDCLEQAGAAFQSCGENAYARLARSRLEKILHACPST